MFVIVNLRLIHFIDPHQPPKVISNALQFLEINREDFIKDTNPHCAQ